MKNFEVRMGIEFLEVNAGFYKTEQRKATAIVFCSVIGCAWPWRAFKAMGSVEECVQPIKFAGINNA
jgi:hypothetical protein